MGWLLTERIPHRKQEGLRHESEYALEPLRTLGIVSKDKSLYIPLRKESELWAEKTLRTHGVQKQDKLVAFHPGASCPSKRWPVGRFAEVAREAVKRYNCKIVILSGPSEAEFGRRLSRLVKGAIDLSGKTKVSDLASILKRCSLFIANDSGPVHIATASGCPVIAIFGRSQKGLSPRRWGPLGEEDRLLHKDVGCRKCLAHNCKIGFKCLMAISSKDVLDEIIKGGFL